MMKLKKIIYFLFFVSLGVSAQNEKLKVVAIVEYDNSYIIKGLNSRLDTINIISVKEKIKKKCEFYKIRIGKEYKFKIRETAFVNNLTIRVGEIIFWKSGDNIKDRPFFTENVKGLYIKKK